MREGRRPVLAERGLDEFYYSYNEEWLRTSKTKNGATTYYYYSGSLLIEEKADSYTIVYLYDINNAPIGFKIRFNDSAIDVWDEYFYEKNLQGDIVAIYDLNGNKHYSYLYDSWGLFARTQHTPSPYTAFLNPLLYRGYYYDSDLGLYYLQSRYYDPNTCRFINADDILGANEDLTSYNLYAYCSNNPVMYSDPTGKSAILTALLIGATIGFVATMLYDYTDDGEPFNGSVGIVDYALNAAVCASIASIATSLPYTYITMPVSSGTAVAVSATGSLAVVTGVSILFASSNRPKDNQKQNKQFDDVMRKLNITDKDTIRRVHDELRRENLGYKELLEFVKIFLNIK